jgi:hypothetical protein
MMMIAIPLATFTSTMITMIFIMGMGFIMITMREGNTVDRYFLVVKYAEWR